MADKPAAPALSPAQRLVIEALRFRALVFMTDPWDDFAVEAIAKGLAKAGPSTSRGVQKLMERARAVQEAYQGFRDFPTADTRNRLDAADFLARDALRDLSRAHLAQLADQVLHAQPPQAEDSQP